MRDECEAVYKELPPLVRALVDQTLEEIGTDYRSAVLAVVAHTRNKEATQALLMECRKKLSATIERVRERVRTSKRKRRAYDLMGDRHRPARRTRDV